MVMSLTLFKPLGRSDRLQRSSRDRLALILTCVAAIAAALFAGDPSPFLERDADLGRLIRGMAIIKGALCVLAFGAVAWRFQFETAPAIALGYVACVAVMTGAAAFVWELTALAFTPIAFHGAWIGLAWIALRGDETPIAFGNRTS